MEYDTLVSHKVNFVSQNQQQKNYIFLIKDINKCCYNVNFKFCELN